MNVWLVIVAAGLGSYLFRISMVVFADRMTMPERLERASTFVAPAAFAALAAGGIAANTAGVDLAGWTAPLAAVAVAVIAVRRTGRPYAALLAGMPTLWILSAVVPA
ncbi:MAG TPA: AzlD domain-containing protein [Jiangellaceae bacterium]|nr:AzlD domain-containing protein [Jiangellaceae bacterium]